jgi:thiamine transporter ThiT
VISAVVAVVAALIPVHPMPVRGSVTTAAVVILAVGIRVGIRAAEVPAVGISDHGTVCPSETTARH